MQRTKNSFVSLLLFIVFVFLGVAFGIGIGNVIGTFNNNGLFVFWKLLDGSTKFIHIADAYSQGVWGQTQDGKTYTWGFNCYLEPKCNQWVEGKAIPANLHTAGEWPLEKGNYCQSNDFKFFRQPPGKVVECVRTWYAGPEFGDIVYYALLDDGKIWAWQYSASMLVDIYLLFGSALLGLILGIIAFTIFISHTKRNKES